MCVCLSICIHVTIHACIPQLCQLRAPKNYFTLAGESTPSIQIRVFNTILWMAVRLCEKYIIYAWNFGQCQEVKECSNTTHTIMAVCQRDTGANRRRSQQLNILKHHSLGRAHGIPLQYSYMEICMDRGVQWAAVHGVARNWA